MAEFQPNTLYYGDNLGVLRDFPPECVDLIYLDPPFNSNRNYNVLFKEEQSGADSEAQIQAFEDTWHWGQQGSATWDIYNEIVVKQDDVGQMLEAFVKALGHNDVTAYLTMMAPRLVELRRVLKPTGSIYLHCDPTASHYLKVLMDQVFGPVNFLSEVIWKRTSAHSSAHRPGPVHDVILAYAKSKNYTWNPMFQPYDEKYIEAFYDHVDPDGRRWRRRDPTGAGTRRGETGEQWRGIDVTAKGRHWMYPPRELDRLDAEGMVHWPKKEGGMPQLKAYLDEQAGVPLQDTWTDIPPIHNLASERLGYPTQKPEALLERIIKASSNEGDVVLDPFCGCGTAVVAAHRLNRKWVGVDVTYLAVDLMKNRLLTTFPGDFKKGVHIDGEPADQAAAVALAERDKYQFQFWAVAKLGGTSRGGENKKGADRGIDGVVGFRDLDPEKSGTESVVYRQVIVSVKGGGTGPTHVRDLIGTVEREKAAMGVLVTIHKPTSAMEKDAAEAGTYEDGWGKTYPKIQIITAADIVHGKRIALPSQLAVAQYQAAPRARRGTQTRLGE